MKTYKNTATMNDKKKHSYMDIKYHLSLPRQIFTERKTANKICYADNTQPQTSPCTYNQLHLYILLRTFTEPHIHRHMDIRSSAHTHTHTHTLSHTHTRTHIPYKLQVKILKSQQQWHNGILFFLFFFNFTNKIYV